MFNREEAEKLLRKYNTNEALIYHAYCVEETMRRFAREYDHDETYWSLVGLLHDIDWGMFPEQHCKKAPELLAEIGADESFIHAVCSHGWGLVTDVEPVSFMEKVLYTIDELTGLVYATALMRPEKMQGMTVKSVKKKWSSKGFAAGVNREIIAQGAQMLDLPLEHIISLTIEAMTEASGKIGL
ncbi:MAG: hydrolase [Sphaerochaeta sp.]|jgi:predicted hydrolase (HD superfamily)|uniref:hydrolase n=1 Tax=Sphaerochaeta sp. TaxID=1972642 RepID=UPI003D0C339A